MEDSVIGFLKKLDAILRRVLLAIGGIVLVSMVVMTCANIVCRQVWVPLRGVFELMGFFGAVVAAFALGYTQNEKENLAVDILLQRFSETTRRVLKVINAVLCLAFAGIAAWQVWKLATTLLRSGEVTETLRIVYYPFTYGVAAGFGVLALVFLLELIEALAWRKEKAS